MDQSRTPSGKLRSVITYLEMTENPNLTEPHTPDGDVQIMRLANPSAAFYRYLYNTIGEDWLWTDRRTQPEFELAAAIRDPKIEIHVLYVDGEPGGYFELARHSADDIELYYFGIMPWLIGKGFGGYLIRTAIRTAWAHAPKRFWLHTCDFDHPDALAFYRKMGFVDYDEQVEFIDDPRVSGDYPRDAAKHVPLAKLS